MAEYSGWIGFYENMTKLLLEVMLLRSAGGNFVHSIGFPLQGMGVKREGLLAG